MLIKLQVQNFRSNITKWWGSIPNVPEHTDAVTMEYWTGIWIQSVFHLFLGTELGNYPLGDPLPVTTHRDTHKGILHTEQSFQYPINKVASFPRIVLRVRGNQGWRMALKRKSTMNYLTLTSATSTREKGNKDFVIQKTFKTTHVQHW